MWVFGFLQQRRERREAIQREASALVTFLDDLAYPEARNRARACRAKGDRVGDRFWSKVAITIARRTGREIGLKAADRYERPAPAQPDAEVLHCIRAINRALSNIVRDQHVETELHNLRAHVHQALALVPAGPALVPAQELVKSAAALASARETVRFGLNSGQYPPELEAAGEALERFRRSLARASR